MASQHPAAVARESDGLGVVSDRLRASTLPVELLRAGKTIVLRSAGETLTRDDLRAGAEAVAGGFHRLGVRVGDRIAIDAADSLNWIVVYLGALRAGACVVPMNPDYKAIEAGYIVADSNPSLIVVDPKRGEVVQGLGVRVLAFADIPRAVPPPMPPLGSDSPALIIYTSGTTGRPKGAVLSHGGLLAQVRAVIDVWQWSSADNLVHSLPLCHLHGLSIGLHGTLLSGGSATLLAFSPEAVVHELTRSAHAASTIFFGVPAMYQRLCEYLETCAVDMSRVRLFVSGSAPLPPALFRSCQRLLGQPPLERYGTTEAGIVTSNPNDGERHPGRVGLPLPGVEVTLGTGDEILVKGAQVFSGYWRKPTATADAFTSGGFFRTGDVGEIGPDGTLAIRGRLKDVIITGGLNVYPREVEIVLESHPAVHQVAVAGLPSDRWGEEVTAFVVPTNAETATAQDLVIYARERLALYKCPRRLVIIDQLPRNAMGKVVKTLLVEHLVRSGT